MSQAIKCSAGHDSSDNDFCSVCGVEITPSAAAPSSSPQAAAPAHTHTGENCPKCTAEREDPASPFCGTCGYNFVTRVGGDVIQQAAPAPAPAAAPSAQPVPIVPVASAPVTAGGAILAGGARMDVVVTVDFSKPGAPRVRPGLTFNLFDEESLIGRKNSAVRQTLAIEDEAVSKRHALIVRNADGTFIIRDLNSTNGTKVNGVDLPAGEDRPLKEGDVVSLGEFTLITVQTIRTA